jgi:hypothetical protein
VSCACHCCCVGRLAMVPPLASTLNAVRDDSHCLSSARGSYCHRLLHRNNKILSVHQYNLFSPHVSECVFTAIMNCLNMLILYYTSAHRHDTFIRPPIRAQLVHLTAPHTNHTCNQRICVSVDGALHNLPGLIHANHQNQLNMVALPHPSPQCCLAGFFKAICQ